MANTQIYDVLPGQPFGRGGDGNATLSSDPHTRRTATGTSGTKTLTLNSAGYANGDLLLIHQTRNPASSTEQNWEVNQISSGGGTTSLTLLNNLARTYSSGCQVLDIKEYINLTISSFTISGWGGSTGGLIAIAALGIVTWSGTITAKGSNGLASSSDQGGFGGNGGGFRGGVNSTDGSPAARGEGWTGTYGSEGQSAAGNGGGGGTTAGAGKNPGGSGGNGAAGGSAGGNGGDGGGAAGNSALTSLFLGGGGGGGRGNGGGDTPGAGGNGGGAMILWGDNITVTGGATFNGGKGGEGVGDADGAGGAGGSVLINGSIVSLGSNKITATGGTATSKGPAGGTGRIQVNYGAKLSGSTSPTYNQTQDTNLNVPKGGIFPLFM